MREADVCSDVYSVPRFREAFMRSVRIVVDPRELARAGAEEFVRFSREAMEARGSFSVALAGGSTPRALYTVLADRREPFFDHVAWDRVRFFFGDERHVPPDHPDSNYRMAYDTLLSKIPIRPGNVARFYSEGEDVAFVASYYETLLRNAFQVGPGDVPRFDLVLLGMGEDGHTASLFPGSDTLHEAEKLATASWIEKLGAHRFTLTPPVLNRAAHVVFLVSGEGKAATLREVLEGEHRPERFPARIVQPSDGTVLWLVDREAGRLLQG